MESMLEESELSSGGSLIYPESEGGFSVESFEVASVTSVSG